MQTNDSFKIEKGVPLPDATNAGLYPFRKLAIGDSFFVPGKSPGDLPAGYWRRVTGHSFTCRKEDGGVRVWRIA